MSNITSNVDVVRHSIASAARRSGRNPESVTLIAVSKTRTVAEIEEALAAGIQHFGENRVQELKEKWPSIRGRAIWHLIGSLQTNKVKPALEMSELIHSLDRDSLADELAKQAERRGAPCRLLVEVNVSGEGTKHGIAPDDLEGFLRRVGASGWVQVQGLMTMAPFSDDPETARPFFRRLRQLSEQIRELGIPNVTMQHLSMGMSGDYVVAIEEGATLVRVGTAIFGHRD